MPKLWYCDKKADCANPKCITHVYPDDTVACSRTSDSKHWVRDFRRCIDLLCWDYPFLVNNATVNIQLLRKHNLPVRFLDDISMRDLLVQCNYGLYSEFDIVSIKTVGQVINFDNPDNSGKFTVTIIITEKEEKTCTD